MLLGHIQEGTALQSTKIIHTVLSTLKTGSEKIEIHRSHTSFIKHIIKFNRILIVLGIVT